ncbi:hypothetical protein [Luteimonas aestuarii]|uniref:hypothetical protein n=1 Tax=Luteimonas aestuarii TaxID=453837 RepID=UPI001A9DFB02|nr:hypothetical protein [Luteimonas aestuarii]
MPQSTSTTRPVMPMVEQLLLGVIGLALVLMLSFPTARGTSALFGWMALWLPGLPLAALLACRLARRWTGEAPLPRPVQVRRRRTAPAAVRLPRTLPAAAARRARRPQAA